MKMHSLKLCCVEIVGVCPFKEIGNFDDDVLLVTNQCIGIFVCGNQKFDDDMQFHKTICLGHDTGPMVDVVVDHIFSKCNS